MEYTPRDPLGPGVGVNIVDWLKAEILDQLDYDFCESCLGPAIFGNGTGVPGWETYRGGDGRWAVREADGHKPEPVVGIIRDHTIDIGDFDIAPWLEEELLGDSGVERTQARASADD